MVVQTIHVCPCIIYGMMIMYLVLRVGVWVGVGRGVLCIHCRIIYPPYHTLGNESAFLRISMINIDPYI
ncbi:hypothetical protein BDV33DRAFT_99009 [Aspergillus novoparasiticus]|uniref:Uncharacterized protein n=2 Tax=Aspergillus subgen. Circumdati TaxID=2720871 RepID=A0A5N6ESN5_9EURO|nr:hypothetical protein BDV33DRAFT_99009 [Aspergillus novoparasiticus]KAE8309815.1 hypothetical protein BDV41DRAFT_416152 [Aspergillus transmontanensis]